MLNFRSQKGWIFFYFLILVLISAYIHKDSILEWPNYIHGRAQSDRLALALNYFHNGFDLFKSETYLFNVEFPYNFSVPKENTIVSVDLPIHEYVIASIMKLIGSKTPFLFRLYMFLYSFIGVWFLFRIGKTLKLKSSLILVVPLIVFTSPVFLYYQDSFLPSITSFSNTIIGLFFYLKFVQTEQKRHYVLGMFFLMLAAISRSIYIIPLLTIIGCESLFTMINSYRKRGIVVSKNVSFQWLVSFIFLLPILLQYLYNNNYMRYEYGSVFLYYLVPANSLEELFLIIQKSISRWMFDYLTPFHYLFILFLLTTLFNKRKVKVDEIASRLILIAFVSFIGFVMFFFAMATKFPFHDYYFLDTFFIPILIGLYVIMYLVQPNLSSKKNIALSSIILIAVFIPSLVFAKANFEERRKNRSWDNIPETVQNFQDVDKILEEIKIPKTAKILVVGPYAPNLPLLMMDRKGYAAMHKSKEEMISALEWDADYIVLQNELYINNFYPHFPKFIYYLEKIYDNGRISISRKRLKPKEVSLEEFFNINKGELKGSVILDFDSPYSKYWQDIERQSDSTLSNSSFGLISKEREFSLNYKSSDINFLNTSESKLEIDAIILFIEKLKLSKMVVSIRKDEKNLFYKSISLSSILDSANKNSWQKVKADISLPRIEENNCEFYFYFWNVKEQFYVDNIELSFYSVK